MTQAWDFGKIDIAQTGINQCVTQTNKQLEDGRATLAELSNAWGGSSSTQYQQIQGNWNKGADDLNGSLQRLQRALQAAGEGMSDTEKSVGSLFGG